MLKQFSKDEKWQDLLERLKNRQIPADQIGHAIVNLGKPFDRAKMLASKDTVAH